MRHVNILVIYSLFSPTIFPIDLLSIAMINLSLKRRKKKKKKKKIRKIRTAKTLL